MQQDPIINHGTLIDTINYPGLISAAANQVNSSPGIRVVSSKKSKVFRKKTRKNKQSKKNVHRRMLKK